MAAGTFTHPEGRKFRVASQRRFVVVGPWWGGLEGRCEILYRTDDVKKATDFRAKKGGFIFDTVAHRVRENVRTESATGFVYRWVEA